MNNVDRLARKFETIRGQTPRPDVVRNERASIGIVCYGTSRYAAEESRDQLRNEHGIETSYLRLKAYPFTQELRLFHRAPRARLRGGPEPRRANAGADAAGIGPGRYRQAPQRALLRRLAAGRAHRHRRNRSPGGVMSTTVTPPPKKVNRIGLEVLNYKGGKTTLCAGCGHNAISERIVECFYEMGVQPWRVAKFSGIGCSSKSPGLLPGLGARLQLGPRARSGHRHGGDPGQPQPAGPGHRRRRHRLDRPRPVHAHAAPQSADDLHHRGQRRLSA